MDILSNSQVTTKRVAIDIGSTVVKIAHIGPDDELINQVHVPRDFEAGIASQVQFLLAELGVSSELDEVLVCSSANGGLRIGIVCLSKRFSGTVLRNQVLLAGANPVFVHDFEHENPREPYVDMLIVGGGIDCEDTGPLAERLQRFDPSRYRFGTLAWAGNRYLADAFQRMHPKAVIIPNPLTEGLSGKSNTVFIAVRDAYLEDLVYKEGVSELRKELAQGIRPTPEVVSRGLLRALSNRSSMKVGGACVLMDIGGATTDFHYAVEIVRDDSEERPPEGVSIGRYVYTDLGTVASRDSVILQMRAHARLYELLSTVGVPDVREVYRLIREGEYEPDPNLLAYACVFLGLDRFARGNSPGLPTANLEKVAEIILSGGASQPLDESILQKIVALFVKNSCPAIAIDRRYRVWVDGITWTLALVG